MWEIHQLFSHLTGPQLPALPPVSGEHSMFRLSRMGKTSTYLPRASRRRHALVWERRQVSVPHGGKHFSFANVVREIHKLLLPRCGKDIRFTLCDMGKASTFSRYVGKTSISGSACIPGTSARAVRYLTLWEKHQVQKAGKCHHSWQDHRHRHRKPPEMLAEGNRLSVKEDLNTFAPSPALNTRDVGNASTSQGTSDQKQTVPFKTMGNTATERS